jgi:hypothetical protein
VECVLGGEHINSGAKTCTCLVVDHISIYAIMTRVGQHDKRRLSPLCNYNSLSNTDVVPDLFPNSRPISPILGLTD